MEPEFIDALQDLQSTIRQHTAMLSRYLEIEEEKRSTWISVEAAARILGLNNSERTNKRKLDAAVRRFGLRYTRTRPRQYNREDIIDLNRRILEGKARI